MTDLNRFLDDLYVGEQAALNAGIVPRWLVESSDGYLPEAYGIPALAWLAVSSPASTSFATATAPTGDSKTICASHPASPTCSRTGWR
jgi:hypothetical protein